MYLDYTSRNKTYSRIERTEEGIILGISLSEKGSIITVMYWSATSSCAVVRWMLMNFRMLWKIKGVREPHDF